MRVIASLIIGIAGIALAACSGGSDVTPTASATATAGPTATSSPTGTATAAPTGTPQPGEPTVEDAVAVIQGYFDAIDARDHRTAYESWTNAGAGSGQTFEEFTAGYATTASATVEIGAPSRVEPAAGSRYIDIPVEITATTTAGETQRFEGSYALRRAVVDGATDEQRAWHIYSADVREVSATN